MRAKTSGLLRRESGRRILSSAVLSQDGITVGRVDDLLVDAHTGRIVYLLIADPASTRCIALPWHLFRIRDGARLWLQLSLTGRQVLGLRGWHRHAPDGGTDRHEP